MSQPAATVEMVEFDAERALIGTMFEHPEYFVEMSAKIDPAWFGDTLVKYVFESCAGLIMDGVMLSPPVIGGLLPENFNGISRGKLIADIWSSAVSREQVGGLIATIRDRWARRQLIAEASRIKAEAGQFQNDPFAVAAAVVSSMDEISASSRESSARRVSIGEAASIANEAAVERAKHGVVSGITWGLRDLDEVTKLYPGELTICAARPSMGKTTLGLHTCLSAAKDGEGVLFASLEMGDLSLGQRVLSATAWNENSQIPYKRIRDGELGDDDLDRLKLAAEQVEKLPLLVEQEAGLTVTQICARARAARQAFRRDGKDLGLVVVDHLGLVSPPDRYAGARHLELGAITTALKALGKDMGVPVLLLCQLSRGVEGRENKRPMLSDLRESGRIEEDADAVVLLYREAYYLERARETDPEKEAARIDRMINMQSVIEINVAKQRQGATKTVEAFVSMPCNVLRNAAKRGWY